jgi:dUTP pyrophosphatase
MKIQIKRHVPDLIIPEKITKGDWIDLRAAEDVWINEGDYEMISLGVSIKLPPNYEAYVIPRSSLFKNFGLIQANSVGMIDSSYCGNSDVWKFPVFCLRGNEKNRNKICGTQIHKNDRICQFRIQEIQPEFEIEEVEDLGEESRGGFGSTGIK